MTIRMKPASRSAAISLTVSGRTPVERLYAAARDTIFPAATSTSPFVAVCDATGRITTLDGTAMVGTKQYRRGNG